MRRRISESVGKFYKVAAQAVLLFCPETCLLTPSMDQALDSFQHRVARQLIRSQRRGRGEGTWSYPPLQEAMVEVGFEGIKKSITRRQNTVAQYIVTQ